MTMTLTRTLLLLPLVVLALAACSNDNGENRPPLDLVFTEPPIDLTGVPVRYAEDVRYGDAERNLFDIFLPDCDGPTPLVIYIHGGGFTGGDKDSIEADLVRSLLQACVAHAAINYTLLDVPSEEEGTASAVAQGGVLTSLED